MAKGRHGGRRVRTTATLLERGEAIVTAEQAALRPRLLARTDDGVVEQEAMPFVAGLGVKGYGQAAAVLLRAFDEVALVMPARATAPQGAGVNRRGVREGWAAVVIVGTRGGALLGRRWYGVPRPDGTTRVSLDTLPRHDLLPIGDFTAPGFAVDPAVDDHFAQLGLPGAVRRVGSPRGTVSDTITMVRPRVPRYDDAPWETARQAGDLLDLTPFDIGYQVVHTTGLPLPLGFAERTVEDLVSATCTEEATALMLPARIRKDPDPLAAYAQVRGDDRLSPSVRAVCLAYTAGYALETGQPTLMELGRELLRTVDTLTAGDPIGWLRSRWPQEPKPGDELASTWAALLAVHAYWRILLARDGGPERHGLIDALEYGAAVRDGLLDLGGVPAGRPGARIVQLTARVLEAPQPPWGEPRMDRIGKARERLVSHAAAWVALPAYLLWHAVVVHTVWTIATSDLLPGGLEGPQPEDIDPAGVGGRGRHVLARRLLLAAMERGESALLDRAVAVAPWDPAVRRIANEGRFRLGRRDRPLLESLRAEETDGGTLGTAAEALAVAQAQGDVAAARTARKRLRERSEAAVELRLAVDRIADLQDVQRITTLRDRCAEVTPDGSRAMFALLGDDPAATVAAWRQALDEQRDAVEWASLVREERAERPRSPRPRRPPCPSEPADGALHDAHRALRWRLGRRALRHHPLGAALEQHARRSLELVAAGDAYGASWLAALGGERGLVAGLDACIAAGGVGDVSEALAAAEAALASALDERWLGAIHERLAAVWATGAVRPAMARERVAIAALAATGPAARQEVEARLSALLTSAVTPSEEPEDPEEATPSGFTPMQVPPAAVEHARRVLGTPEWAIQEGLRQVLLYNRTLGRRDLKMLRGTRDADGALWELRHRDGRNPVRVVYRSGSTGPEVVSILAKQNDAHQRRAIATILAGRDAG